MLLLWQELSHAPFFGRCARPLFPSLLPITILTGESDSLYWKTYEGSIIQFYTGPLRNPRRGGRARLLRMSGKNGKGKLSALPFFFFCARKPSERAVLVYKGDSEVTPQSHLLLPDFSVAPVRGLDGNCWSIRRNERKTPQSFL